MDIYFTLHGYDNLHKFNHKIYKTKRLHYLELINAKHNPDIREQHTTHTKKLYTTSPNKISCNIRYVVNRPKTYKNLSIRHIKV